MTKIEAAIERMTAAITALEGEIEAAAAKMTAAVDTVDAEVAEIPELMSERDQLADEVKALRERAEEDARLRAEAAVAVREALDDLRGVVQHGAA